MENRGLTVARKFELRGKEGRKELGSRIQDSPQFLLYFFQRLKLQRGTNIMYLFEPDTVEFRAIKKSSVRDIKRRKRERERGRYRMKNLKHRDHGSVRGTKKKKKMARN